MKQPKLTLDQFISPEQMARIDRIDVSKNGVTISVEKCRMDMYEILRSVELEDFRILLNQTTTLTANVKKTTDMLTTSVRIAGESMTKGNRKLREDLNKFEVTVPDFLMEDDKVILTVYGINSTMGIVGSYMGPTMTIVTSDKDYKALNNSVHVVVSDKETIMGIINKSLSQRFIASISVLSEANTIRFEMGLPFAPAYMYFPNGYPTDQTTKTNQEDNTNVVDQESVH